MPLTNGSKLGPYEIVSPLGAGGMGEVYRARDSKLGRDVALKVISEQFANDVERMARFEREAKVLAALNHPNIAHIYGLEDSGGVRALVMELVEGQTLAERIARGPIPLEETLSIAKQIAEALEYAHERGIVHRDLKPANVKITPDGAVKVLDFGLAKAIEGNSGVEEMGNSPTLSMGATRAGVILGTAAYMSPEQAKGKSADRRADIWSFGVVLYEMLSGKQMYGGETAPETLAHVITKDPSWESLPAATPTAIRNLLERCLTKDPKARLQAIGEARIIIERYLANPAASTSSIERISPEQQASRRVLPWSIASLALAIALLAAWAPWRQAPEGMHAARLSFVPPPESLFEDSQSDTVVVSPDGEKLAFTARSPQGKAQLWVRALDSADVQMLPGTEGAIEPFWSPDSKSIAFGAKGKLKRVDLSHGTAQTLCDAARLTGGSWSPKGVIIFGPDYRTQLFQIPATGGEPKAVTVKNSERGDDQHSHPFFLPDGNHFLFRININPGSKGIWIGSLDSPVVNQLLPDNTTAAYAPPGWLLYVRNEVLVAQEFDAGSMKLKGETHPLVTNATGLIGGVGGSFSVSDNGVLVWNGAWDHDYQLVWLDREGKQTGVVGPVVRQSRDGQQPRLSPDGTRVAIKRDNDIWVVDLTHGIPTRLMPGQSPIWSPDGKKVALLGGPGLSEMPANGVGEAETLAAGVNPPADWTRDGRFIIFWRRGDKTRSDIWALPLFGDKKAYPILNSEFDEINPRLSSDGKWIAYASDETGDHEVYVRSFTADGKVGTDKKRISTSGGSAPVWRRDGQELFYLSGDYQLMSVSVKKNGAEMSYGAPVTLFKMRTLSSSVFWSYDAAADGKRFLVGMLIADGKSMPPTVILNWSAELNKK
jgi:eukaryotic-like serine/threonine-protein kinase